MPSDCCCHHHWPKEHPQTAGPHYADQSCRWVSHSHPCTTARWEPLQYTFIVHEFYALIKKKKGKKSDFERTIPFHGITLYFTWSPGTLGVILHGRFVIIPRTVSTDSMGTEKWKKFKANHPECFQEQYKMMDGSWDCKSISNFVLLIPAKLNHQSSFLKIKRKASSKKWSELKLDKMRNVLWFLEI